LFQRKLNFIKINMGGMISPPPWGMKNWALNGKFFYP